MRVLIDRLGIRARRDFLQRVNQADLLIGHISQPFGDVGVDRKPSHRVLVQVGIEPPQRNEVGANPFPIVDALMRRRLRQPGQTRLSLRMAFSVLVWALTAAATSSIFAFI